MQVLQCNDGIMCALNAHGGGRRVDVGDGEQPEATIRMTGGNDHAACFGPGVRTFQNGPRYGDSLAPARAQKHFSF